MRHKSTQIFKADLVDYLTFKGVELDDLLLMTAHYDGVRAGLNHALHLLHVAVTENTTRIKDENYQISETIRSVLCSHNPSL